MWLFTIYGMFSVVTLRTDFEGNPPHVSTVMLRARSREHLHLLADRFPELHAYPILEQPRSDYLYRRLVPAELWAEIAGELAKEVTWDNFKSEVQRRPAGKGEPRYLHVLHRIWSVALQLTPRAHHWFTEPMGEPQEERPEDHLTAEELAALDGDRPRDIPF